LGLCVSGAIPMAYAGFQFTAPAQPVQNNQNNVPPLNGALLPTPENNIEIMPAAPQRSISNVQSLPPQAIVNPKISTPAPKTGLGSLSPATSTPMSIAPANPKIAQQSNQLPVAVGFGNDLPLVTALRQVIPDNYTYVLEESVPMGQSVSWNGGRPWDQVLADMIGPMGLRANIANDKVIITNENKMANVASMPEPIRDMRPSTQYAMAPTNVVPASPIMSDVSNANAMPSVPQAVETPIIMAPASMPVTQMRVEGLSSVSQMNAPTAPLPSRVVPQVTRGNWSAVKGDSLRNVLEEWTGQAGAELFWSSDYDYPLAGDVNVSGTFEEATENLLLGFEQARPKPVARLHPNLPHGPAVLVVETIQTLD
jgi:hypothetical protein